MARRARGRSSCRRSMRTATSWPAFACPIRPCRSARSRAGISARRERQSERDRAAARQLDSVCEDRGRSRRRSAQDRSRNAIAASLIISAASPRRASRWSSRATCCAKICRSCSNAPPPDGTGCPASRPASTSHAPVIAGLSFHAMSHTVGFIGLGLMGKPMARNLLKKGFSVIVHSRSRGPVDELAKDGATTAGSPAEVARSRQTHHHDAAGRSRRVEGARRRERRVRRDVKGHRHRRLEHDRARRSRAASRPARRELGSSMLDAPVSGGEIGAIDGTLTFMVGGDAARARIRARDLERDGQTRSHRPRRRIRRRSDLQGLQSDRARRDDGGGRRGDRACRARPASIR